MTLFESSAATYSPCTRYRYTLWYRWGAGPMACFLMLNPSTATEHQTDPTVERCKRRAIRWGYGGLLVLNAYSYRATDPRNMQAQADPVGPDNDAAIETALREHSVPLVVCGWGRHATQDRVAALWPVLRQSGSRITALRVLPGNVPGHPLYIGYDAQPVDWRG